MCAFTLTLTAVPIVRLNGVAVKVLIGTVHDRAEMTVDDVPSHEVVDYHVAPSDSRMLIV